MALEIVWTPQAEAGYAKVIHYLEENWTEKEVGNFVGQSRDFFELLSEYPEILQKTGKKKHVHRGPINKHTILTYRIMPKRTRLNLST